MSEEAPHIPLEEHVHVEVNQEPPQGQIDESQREQDPARAEAMAYAGDEYRTKAKDAREIIRGEDFAQGLTRLDNNFGKDPEHDRFIEESRNRQAAGNRIILRNETKAMRVEKWAGILHDNPVTDDYKELFPEFSFNAETMSRIEQNCHDKLKEAHDLEEALEEDTSFQLRVMFDDNYNNELSIDSLMKLYGAIFPDDETAIKRQEWTGLINDENTTLGQLSEYHADLAKKLVVDVIRNEAKIYGMIMHDVKNGRASEQQPQQTE